MLVSTHQILQAREPEQKSVPCPSVVKHYTGCTEDLPPMSEVRSPGREQQCSTLKLYPNRFATCIPAIIVSLADRINSRHENPKYCRWICRVEMLYVGAIVADRACLGDHLKLLHRVICFCISLALPRSRSWQQSLMRFSVSSLSSDSMEKGVATFCGTQHKVRFDIVISKLICILQQWHIQFAINTNRVLKLVCM